MTILAGGSAVLKGERVEYGKPVVASLASDLDAKSGRGWFKRNLMQMIKFSDNSPDFQIVQTLFAQ
ncbi:MAG: hypothetical protein L3J89_05475 [Gammaproteobacteria bacterium]|nr:hypothetical protein [Gammaproteobacteria bacterium]